MYLKTVIAIFFTINFSIISLYSKDAVTRKEEKSNFVSIKAKGVNSPCRGNIENCSRSISLHKKALSLASQGKYDSAIRLFKRVSTSINVELASIYHNIGYTYELIRAPQDAISYYKKALAIDSKLVTSLQNLATLLYFKGEIKDAVRFAKKLLSLDPRNNKVLSWYKKLSKSDLEKYSSNNRGIYDNVADLYRSSQIRKSKKRKKEKKTDLSILVREVSFGFTNHLSLLFPFTVSYILIPAFSRIQLPPVNFYINILGSRNLSISLSINVPRWGVAIPLFITGEQRLEGRLQFRKFYIGLGLLFTQVNLNFSNVFSGRVIPENFIRNTESPLLEDVKLGLNFGYYSEYGNIRIVYYSRWLFPDYTIAFNGVRIDRNLLQIKYEYRFSEYGDSGLAKFLGSIRFFAEIVTKEIFITEYQVSDIDANLQHYLGVYDFRLLGFEYGLSIPEGGTDRFSIGFSYALRLYLRNDANENFSSFGSGNGFFGLNFGEITTNPLPGLRSLAHVLTIFSKQNIFKGFILSEAIGFEFVDVSLEIGHDFFFEIRASYLFSSGL